MTENPTALSPLLNAYRPDRADISLKPFVIATEYIEPVLRRCKRGIVPLFEKPDQNAIRLSEIKYGEFLDVFEERRDGFAWVQNRSDRYVGYIPLSGTLDEGIAALMNRVSALQTFVYAEPDARANVIDRLTLGSFISLDGDAGDFYPIATGGYVFKKHIAPADEVACADYVFTAGQLLNAPYLVGGRTPLGIDAPGLLQLALELAGYDMPRGFEQQKELMGHPLPCHWRDIIWKRGDVVFFAEPDLVGIMTGNTHALCASPHHMMVTVEPLEDIVARGHTVTAAGHP